MRIHEIEIYSSKQIRAFIKYLEASAEEQETREEQQKQWANSGLVGGMIGGGAGLANAQCATAYTQEGLARAIAEKQAAELASQKTSIE